ncbi:MAG TPA: ribonuclease H-like domain-containing protein [Candidatus Hydrogenedentes bacterium]|nr:ribonuclease H-like domain-containing protein [Candidatus Hydrogenedentota bacterium]
MTMDRDELIRKLNLMRGSDLPVPPPRAPENTEETPPPAGGTLAEESRRRLQERLGLMQGADWAARREEEARRAAVGGYEVERVLGGEVVGDDASAFFLLRREYPLEHFHGAFSLGAGLESRGAHLALAACDESLAGADPREAVFMDTETTGLAGGAGTVAFLVGMGYHADGMFRVDQCFLRDYDDEPAMLKWIAGLLSRFKTVVSFNGKSFDLPLLRTRFVQHRMPCRFDALAHLDLVHAARRFWKRRLSDCSLGNLEREVLGVRRHGDVPSHLIPERWLEYLHTRDARPLEGVFYHHRVDILSMVTLLGALSSRLDRPEGSEFDHDEDQLSLIRLHFREKRYDQVLAAGAEWLRRDAPPPLRRECLEMLSLAGKRRGRWEETEAFLDQWHAEFPADAAGASELAKHLEHRARNLARAERVCRETLALLDASPSGECAGAGELRGRLARIRRKLGGLWGGADADAGGD